MRCVLIYNPASGRNRHLRAVQLRQIVEALVNLGHQVESVTTWASGSATAQARNAVRGGADIVFACGGDGTVHEVLQGLVSETCEHSVALGTIPLGSANALARHMRLSLDPVRAALQQIEGKPQTIPIGRIAWSGKVRYFAVMAGAGPDGALVYDLLTSHKSKIGRLAYYLRAVRLFATRRFDPFEVEYADSNSGVAVTRQAVSVMAVRVDSLGGFFNRLTDRRACIEDDDLQLLILSPPAWFSLPLWFVCGWLGLNGFNKLLHSVRVKGFSCTPYSVPCPHFQADGEWLGRIPMQVSLVQNAVRILKPDL